MTSSILRLLLITVVLLSFGSTASAATWLVDSRGAANGDGSTARPFTTLREAQEASGAGDTIVIARGSGPYAESIELKEGQTLTAASDPATEKVAVIDAKGTAAIVVRNASGITIHDIAIELSGDADGVVLDRVTGNVSLRGGGLTGRSSGTAIRVDGGDASIAIERFPIAIASGTAVAIRNRRGGAVAFGEGSPITVSLGARPAVVLTDNKGQYAFNDAVRVTTSGAPSLTIRKTERVSMTAATNELAATGAEALLVGGSVVDLRLRSMSIDGATQPVEQGALIEGATGTIVVTGDATTPGSGGTIRGVKKRGISIARSSGITLRNMIFSNSPSANGIDALKCGTPAASGEHLACAAAIHLQDVSAIDLDRIRIEDSAQAAIAGDTVRDLTMTSVEIRGAGDETNEHGVQFRNVAGALRVEECTIEGSEARQLFVLNDTGEATIDVRKSSFRGGPPPNGQQGILLQTAGDARLRFTVDGVKFADHFSNAIQLVVAGTSDVNADITGSTFRGSAAAVATTIADAAKLAYRIAGNTIANSTSTAINVHGTTSGAISGAITRNLIGVQGESGSGAVCGGGCNGITLTAMGRGSSAAIISGNTIQQIDGNGILARASGDATLRVQVAGNVIREPVGSDALYAIALMAGSRSADRAYICGEIGGDGDRANMIAGSWNTAGGGGAIGIMRRGEFTTLAIADYAGDRTSVANLSKFVAGRNRGGAVDASIGGGVTIAACSLP